MCRSVHTGKAGGSYWVCFATVGTVLQSSLLLCTALHCFILLCTVLYYFALGLFCNGANIFGTLSSTPCVCFMLYLNNFTWQLAKLFLNELKWNPPFLYSGSNVHYWLLIVKKITFTGIVLFFGKTPNKFIPQRHFGACVNCGSFFLTLTLIRQVQARSKWLQNVIPNWHVY